MGLDAFRVSGSGGLGGFGDVGLPHAKTSAWRQLCRGFELRVEGLRPQVKKVAPCTTMKPCERVSSPFLELGCLGLRTSENLNPQPHDGGGGVFGLRPRPRAE